MQEQQAALRRFKSRDVAREVARLSGRPVNAQAVRKWRQTDGTIPYWARPHIQTVIAILDRLAETSEGGSDAQTKG